MATASAASTALQNEEQLRLFDRIVDVVTVVLISIAAIGSAWCGYQASRWSGLQTLDYSLANAARVHASIAATRSTIARVGEAAIFVQYESAVFNHNEPFASFLYRRFPPELRTAVDAWLASKPLTNANAPLSPFAMPQYHLKSQDESEQDSRRADQLTRQAVDANRQSDEFVLLTVLFASVSFLGGVATKMRFPRHVVVTLIGTALLLAAIVRMLQFPMR